MSTLKFTSAILITFSICSRRKEQKEEKRKEIKKIAKPRNGSRAQCYTVIRINIPRHAAERMHDYDGVYSLPGFTVLA